MPALGIHSKFPLGLDAPAPEALAALRDQPHEVFACLFLDTRHRVIAFEELFHGTIDGEPSMFVIAIGTLDISTLQFVERVAYSTDLNDFMVGMIKAPFAAVIIALVGCLEGLSVEKPGMMIRIPGIILTMLWDLKP